MRKLIIEIRFKPNLTFYKVKEDIGISLQKYFPDWRTDGLHITFANFPIKTQCFIEFNRLAYVCEDVKDIETQLKNFKKIYDTYTSLVKFESTKRVGVRNTIVNKIPLKYQELVSIFQERFFNKKNSLDSILVKQYKDVVFSADFEKDNYDYHYLYGPVKKIEAIKRLGLNFKPDESDFDDTNSYLDIDCFSEKSIANSVVMNKLEEMQKISDKLADESFKYLAIKQE